ncbi:MAG: 4-hydroxythreonine-4-phosphate dehydrogenase PdxA [Alphaproteobacteria bacterium]|nr:4-hydroxythreonine-4-phosphate dehydrogenase PdxA [Alphaproteobacteria bacterium]
MPNEPERPLVVTMGEPAGIGGEIAIAAWKARNSLNLPVFALIDDPARLTAIDPALPISEIDSPDEAGAVFDNALPVLPLSLPAPVEPGRPNPENGRAVLGSIEAAVSFCMAGTASGLVTNPIHKGILYQAGFHHPGHTEFLAELGNVPRTVMMLANDQLRAVPVTVHVSLSAAATTLTPELIVDTCRIVHHDLIRWFGLTTPRLAVAGLNPHAGEGGALGTEEQTIIAPALDQLRSEGLNICGPLPGDTMFHAEARERYDVAICMYHDQALIPVKTLDFHGGVNVTLGLPFIRTSPDHGTAFDLAGTGKARPDSLVAAIQMAGRMAQHRDKAA